MNIENQISTLQNKFDEIETTNRALNNKLSELFILYNLTRILNTTFDLDQILKNIFQLFKESLTVDYCSLYLNSKSSETLNLNQKYSAVKQGQEIALYPEKKILEEILKNKKLSNQAIFSIAELELKKEEAITLPLQYLGCPLLLEDQSAIGVLNFFRRGTTAFSAEELHFFTRITHEVSNILDKILLYVRTKEDTFRDHLTGTYNRRYFSQRLQIEIKRAERYKRNLSLLIIDIDDFKDINDQFGHNQGDETLKKLVQILQKNIRNCDILARYGGDEFVALLPETNTRNTGIVGEKLRKAVAMNLFIMQESIKKKAITVSIGIANFPADSYSPESLIERADQRLYLAKKQGKNCTVYSEENSAVL